MLKRDQNGFQLGHESSFRWSRGVCADNTWFDYPGHGCSLSAHAFGLLFVALGLNLDMFLGTSYAVKYSKITILRVPKNSGACKHVFEEESQQFSSLQWQINVHFPLLAFPNSAVYGHLQRGRMTEVPWQTACTFLAPKRNDLSSYMLCKFNIIDTSSVNELDSVLF